MQQSLPLSKPSKLPQMKTSLLFLFCLLAMNSLHAQDCSCTIKQVETNTVEPCDFTVGTIVQVASTSELKNAISQANNNGGNMTILIEDGTYPIATTSWYPYITASNIVFRSASGNRDAVILTGTGMAAQSSGTEIGIFAVGDNITVADLTIKDIANHGIAVSGENLFVHNVKIQNTFEQMLKGVSANGGADDAIIQCSLFEYPAGIGPQYYIGGIDIHDGDNCIVRDNIFKNIASPSMSLAEHAVHFWNSSSNNIVERNQIINCDRGVGFGLGSSANEGGIIRNNMIYNDGHHDYDDVGIGVETSPNTKIYNNTIYIDYPNAIEYRFEETTGVEVVNNITNRQIRSRNGGQADERSNIEQVSDNWFIDLTSGDLRLASAIPELVDQGEDLGGMVAVDIDLNPRPNNGSFDLGAYEFEIVSTSIQDKNPFGLKLYPNPTNEGIFIQTDKTNLKELKIWSSDIKIVYSLKNHSSKGGIYIETQNWRPGMYIVQVYGAQGQVQSMKFLVKK